MDDRLKELQAKIAAKKKTVETRNAIEAAKLELKKLRTKRR